MKTKQIKGQCDILLICGLPQDAKNFRWSHGNLCYDCLIAPEPFNIPPGPWQYHCRLSEITEEQAKALVRSSTDSYGRPYQYENYLFSSHPFQSYDLSTAIKSFQSLLEANGVLKENTFGERPNVKDEKYWRTPFSVEIDNVSFSRDLKNWQLLEQNVFNPETTLVFIKTE